MIDYTDINTNQLLEKDKIHMKNKVNSQKDKWVLHSHDGFEIFYFHEGIASYIIGDGVYQLSPGDMLVFNGQLLHRANPSKRQPYIRSFLNFLPSYLEGYIPRNTLQEILTHLDNTNGLRIQWGVSERNEIETYFSRISAERERCIPGYETMIKSYLSQLLIKILRKSIESEFTLIGHEISQKEKHVNRILNFINQKYKESLSLDIIADALHLNKYYMCHCFKEVTGITINKFLANRRIDEAKKLLLSTGEPITKISEMLGFKNAIHFSRLFKQYIEISPQSYRNRYSKKSKN